MQISSWVLYLMTRLDAICGASEAIVILSAIAGVSAVFTLLVNAYNDNNSYNDKEEHGMVLLKRTCKILITSFVVSLILTIIVPTTKEMAFIYIAPKALKSAEVQKLPNNVLRVLNVQMESYLKSLNAPVYEYGGSQSEPSEPSTTP